jgi:YfiH family protein
MAWRISRGWCWDPAFERAAGSFARVTTAALGDMKKPRVFARALRRAGLPPAGWAAGDQVHGRALRTVSRPTAPGRFRAVDGLLTGRPGLALRVHAADCVPVFVAAPAARAAALVHAGWRGAAAGILPRAVRRLAKDFDANPADLRVSLGPHIRSCCYTVGPDVARRFRRYAGAVRPSKGKSGEAALGLETALRRQALAAGVRPGRFTSAPYCTGHDRRFYSFRRTKTERRMAAVMALRP